MMRQTITLADCLDFDQARDLHLALRDLPMNDLAIDGTAVRHVGALAAQILVAAARDWRAKGREFLLSASPELHDDLLRLGLLYLIPLKEEAS